MSGRPLAEVVEEFGQKLTGAACPAGKFPMLFKIIDATADLSVQVHPDESAAADGYGEAKTELWYVIDAEPGAKIYAGFDHRVTADDLRAALTGKALPTLLHAQPVSAGDAILLPGGTVHAIGAGCLIYEIQQNSNTTYRIYDWDRVDANGESRELHLDKAMRVIRWNAPLQALLKPRRLPCLVAGNEHSEINKSLHFHITRWRLSKPQSLSLDGRSFEALFVCHGACVVSSGGMEVELSEGTSCLVPAILTSYVMTPRKPDTVILRTALGS